MPKRSRPTFWVCPDCREPGNVPADHIDFHAVYVSLLVRQFMQDKGRIPNDQELAEMDESSGSDPCDTCCCGACGSRKEYAGQCHC